MDLTQLTSVGVGLALTALFCLASMFNALGRRRTFERELAATRAGQYAPDVAYQRYSSASTRSGIINLRANLIILLLIFGALLYFSLATPDATFGLSGVAYDDRYLIFFLLPIAVFSPMVIYTLLVAAWADTPAFVQLRHLPTRPGDLLALRTKSACATVLPIALLMEIAAVCYALGVDGLVCFFGFLLGFILYAIIISRLGPVLLRWYYPTKPIEETEWAEWGARAQEWSRLAGAPIHRVYVRYTAPYGVADGAHAGSRPQTLFLSDVFLHNSDWRQRDALICLLLAVSDRNRRRTQRRLQQRGAPGLPGQPGQAPQRGATVRISGAALLAFAVIVVAVALVAAFAPQIAAALPFPIDLNLVINLLPFLVLVLLLILLFRTSLRARRRGPLPNNIYMASDALAASLCGDPLALMAAILGVNLLSGMALDRRYVAAAPSALDRVAALERSLQQPGSYAPWAAQPIPAVTPVRMGPYTMSAPISPAAVAERPAGPVPQAPYPITQSPWAATPLMAAPYGAPVPPPASLYDSSQFPQPVAYPPSPEAYAPAAVAPPAVSPPHPYAAPTAPFPQTPPPPLG